MLQLEPYSALSSRQAHRLLCCLAILLSVLALLLALLRSWRRRLDADLWEWASNGGVGRWKMRQNARVKVVVQFGMPALVLRRA